MEFITNNWHRYFEGCGEGLGTTYERFVLHRYFQKLRKAYSIGTVLEFPSFGMTGISGINSMWWACTGANVTVIDDLVERLGMVKKVWEAASLAASFVCCGHEFPSLPFRDDGFDMSWNFASLPLVPEVTFLLKEITRVTKKVIFIVIPNTASIAAFLGPYWGGNCRINPIGLVDEMSSLHWSVEERGFFDVPPWPDIAMKKEDLLRRIGFSGLADRLEARSHSSNCIVDYFMGLRPNMERELLKYSFFENIPNFLKRFWAHHQYFVFVPKDE